MELVSRSIELGNGQVVTVEYGKLARQADGAIWLTVGDVRMLATVVARKEINPLTDFLPLSVDYKENYSATGKFPGGFFKRDGRLNDYEILTSRIVDRSLRPLFPEDYHADIQVIITVYSADRMIQTDAYACLAASTAVCVSDIPFPDPVSTVRIVYKDGQFIINPTYEQTEGADLELVVGGTIDSINMVEGEANEVSEELMVEALKTAHQAIKKLNEVQLELRKAVGKTFRDYEKPLRDEQILQQLEAFAQPQVKSIFDRMLPKQERSSQLKAIKEACLEKFLDKEHEQADQMALMIKTYYEDVVYKEMRAMILDKNTRIDGRRPDQIRPISGEVAVLPRSHGSSLFTRGETQSLSTITLGSKMDEQTIDYATQEGSKKFMLQYNFPPFSTGETKFLRGPSRREVGHGNLAERALRKVIPSEVEHTIRITSDILESNGSSSMATVCAGCMALMDSGIPIRRPVSGIAMGLILEGDRFAVLSDILGDEDHLGDMDFKVTGTEKGITACQMDIKVRGLSYEILTKALYQAKDGRAHILGKMLEVIAEPRPDIAEFAPRILKLTIPQDTIGAVIGPGGKIIQEIQRETGTVIAIEEYDNLGHVTIASSDKVGINDAAEWIRSITAKPEVGQVFHGVVKGMKESGAFVEFMPGREGWLHISEVAYERIPSIEDAIQIGDEFDVKLIEVDAKAGKFRLSKRALMPKPEGWVDAPPRERGDRDRDRGRGGDRRDRGGDRRDGGRDRRDGGDRRRDSFNGNGSDQA
ncbi:MAG: polyribonucleotide nucleotidyltransferase [Bacteroidetes bacterium]|nr:polyribonucleotide nucleotidyltransferase [Bacteroidota bacterium]